MVEKDPGLDVAVLCCGREVCGGDKRPSVVNDDALGVQGTALVSLSSERRAFGRDIGSSARMKALK
jgi:hypothetical protein